MVIQTQPGVIRFSYQAKSFPFSHRNKIKLLLKRLFNDEGKTLGSLSYVFCTDDFLLDINTRYLSHDYYTDIITFDLSDMPSEIFGEIYISVDRVRENALEFQTTFQTELRRVIFHGALHLCGFNDHTSSQKKTMRQKEEQYLHLLKSEV